MHMGNELILIEDLANCTEQQFDPTELNQPA
jgi:hypothetical protein